MAAMLKALFGRLLGRETAEGGSEAIEHEGFRIRPTPYRRMGQYQTCGVIEKMVAGELKEHRFVRAEMHPSRAAAVEFSIGKARQLIDEQGDRLFG
jgi:hypothetical protein